MGLWGLLIFAAGKIATTRMEQVKAAACKNVSFSDVPMTPTCGGAPSLAARSYLMPPRWPLPAIKLVMESLPNACDYYRSSKPCCALVHQTEQIVERQVREVLVSFLASCNARLLVRPPRPCRVVDFGANNGWMSMIMLALGANVTSVEPAPDLAAAVGESAEVNCWADRHRVLNVFACASNDIDEPTAFSCMRPKIAWDGYRAGGGGSAQLKGRLNNTLTHGWTFAHVLTVGAAWGERVSPVHYDLLKLDGDGPEGGWMRALHQLIVHQRVSVTTIVLEGNFLDDTTMFSFQNVLGFDVYRLDFGDSRRHMAADGWDLFSDRGTMHDAQRPTWSRDALEEELLSQRAMRRLWRVRPNMSKSNWSVLLGPATAPFDWARKRAHHYRRIAHQWLLTRERMPFNGPVNRPAKRSSPKVRWWPPAEHLTPITS